MSQPNSRDDSYLTLAGSACAEIKVQRSRFLAEAAPAADEAAARKAIETVARQYHDCRHICYGWRLGISSDVQEIHNDAGEPSGTAGEPILNAIRQAGLTDCVTIVARYFGGIKLGTGGLSRAYAGAAQAAVAKAERRTVLLGREFYLHFSYQQQKTIGHLLKQHRGKTVSEEFTEAVDWHIWLPNSTWQGFADSLREATAGTVSVQAIDDSDI